MLCWILEELIRRSNSTTRGVDATGSVSLSLTWPPAPASTSVPSSEITAEMKYWSWDPRSRFHTKNTYISVSPPYYCTVQLRITVICMIPSTVQLLCSTDGVILGPKSHLSTMKLFSVTVSHPYLHRSFNSTKSEQHSVQCWVSFIWCFIFSCDSGCTLFVITIWRMDALL